MGRSSAAAHSLSEASYNESEDGSRPSNTAANKNTVALIPDPQYAMSSSSATPAKARRSSGSGRKQPASSRSAV